jgi:hypothetical protein
VTADTQEDKNFETEIMLQDIKSISIGAQDYIMAFNYPIKTVRSGGDFVNLLLFDLQSGRTINNAEVKEFGAVNDVKDVKIVNVAVQNNEIHVFTEAKIETIIKKPATASGGFGGFPESFFTFGPAHVFVMGLDGNIKAVKKLTVDNSSKADFYHTFGLTSIKGNYWLNTGNYAGFYQLTSGFDKNPHGTINFYPYDPLRNDLDYGTKSKFVNRLVAYFPDTNKALFARTINDNQLSLVSVTMN